VRKRRKKEDEAGIVRTGTEYEAGKYERYTVCICT
jgi:hypothetical protein